jgi:hypothetical protein
VLRRPAILLALVLAASLAAGGCRRSAPAVSVAWQERPASITVDVPAFLQIVLRDGTGNPIDGAALRIEAHMQHPGMAPVVETAEGRGKGIYAARVSLTMAGEWIVIVSGELPGGRRIREQAGAVIARPAG